MLVLRVQYRACAHLIRIAGTDSIRTSADANKCRRLRTQRVCVLKHPTLSSIFMRAFTPESPGSTGRQGRAWCRSCCEMFRRALTLSSSYDHDVPCTKQKYE